MPGTEGTCRGCWDADSEGGLRGCTGVLQDGWVVCATGRAEVQGQDSEEARPGVEALEASTLTRPVIPKVAAP